MEVGRRARVVVRGRVQGVFFRAETSSMASRLGLSGWVMNRRDGAVEAVFEGDEAALAEAVEWMSHGPRGARVEDVETAWEDPRGEESFRVVYH